MIDILCADLRHRAVNLRGTVHPGGCAENLHRLCIQETPECDRASLVLLVYQI